MSTVVSLRTFLEVADVLSTTTTLVQKLTRLVKDKLAVYGSHDVLQRLRGIFPYLFPLRPAVPPLDPTAPLEMPKLTSRLSSRLQHKVVHKVKSAAFQIHDS